MDVRQSALRRAIPTQAPAGTYPCGRPFVRRLKPTRRPAEAHARRCSRSHAKPPTLTTGPCATLTVALLRQSLAEHPRSRIEMWAERGERRDWQGCGSRRGQSRLGM